VTALVRGEMIKVRTTRTALGFALASVLLVVAVVLITILADDPVTVSDKRDALGIGGALAVPLLLFGIVGATGEFRHRTLAPAVLIAPDRFRLTLARLIAYMFTAALVGVAMVAVALVLGLPLLAGQAGPDLDGGDYVRVIGGGIVAVTLCAAIGVGFGVLVKNQVAGVVGALVWVFILEPLVGVIDEDLLGYTITTAAAVVGGTDAQNGLSFAGSVLVLAAWAAVFVAAALLVDRRRDVD
jgi:ABC-2 type transport system permease protein